MEVGSITCYKCKEKGYRQRHCPRRLATRAQVATVHMPEIMAADDVANIRGVFAVDVDETAVLELTAGLARVYRPATAQVEARTTVRNRDRTVSSVQRKFNTGQVENKEQ